MPRCRAGDSHQAQAIFGKLAAQQPESALGPLGLAELAVGRNDFEAASRQARRALELAPASLQAQRLSILVAMRQGRPQDATAVARSMQVQRPDEAMGYILEGEIEADQKRWDASAQAFRKALATPNPLHASTRLHAVMLKGGKAAEAAGFADTWLAQHPSDMLFLLHLGDTAAAQGDLPLAERRYAQAVASQPQNPMALSKAAWSLTQQKKPGAVSLAERALAAAPGQPALLDGLSLALASEGQHALAIERQKKVVAQAPDAPMHRLTLARIYLQAGDRSGARGELEAIQRLGKEFTGKDEAERMLKSINGA
jgi:FimV-like protein